MTCSRIQCTEQRPPASKLSGLMFKSIKAILAIQTFLGPQEKPSLAHASAIQNRAIALLLLLGPPSRRGNALLDVEQPGPCLRVACFRSLQKLLRLVKGQASLLCDVLDALILEALFTCFLHDSQGLLLAIAAFLIQ